MTFRLPIRFSLIRLMMKEVNIVSCSAIGGVISWMCRSIFCLITAWVSSLVGFLVMWVKQGQWKKKNEWKKYGADHRAPHSDLLFPEDFLALPWKLSYGAASWSGFWFWLVDAELELGGNCVGSYSLVRLVIDSCNTKVTRIERPMDRAMQIRMLFIFCDRGYHSRPREN